MFNVEFREKRLGLSACEVVRQTGLIFVVPNWRPFAGESLGSHSFRQHG